MKGLLDKGKDATIRMYKPGPDLEVMYKMYVTMMNDNFMFFWFMFTALIIFRLHVFVNMSLRL
jgi:hypothetical protein